MADSPELNVSATSMPLRLYRASMPPNLRIPWPQHLHTYSPPPSLCISSLLHLLCTSRAPQVYVCTRATHLHITRAPTLCLQICMPTVHLHNHMPYCHHTYSTPPGLHTLTSPCLYFCVSLQLTSTTSYLHISKFTAFIFRSPILVKVRKGTQEYA